MSKYTERDDLVAHALRLMAGRMCEKPDEYSVEEGKALDRALRSCKGIIDIDVVWVMWRYVAEKRGWLTYDELVRSKSGLRYISKEAA
jgi:hypothetical protein